MSFALRNKNTAPLTSAINSWLYDDYLPFRSMGTFDHLSSIRDVIGEQQQRTRSYYQRLKYSVTNDAYLVELEIPRVDPAKLNVELLEKERIVRVSRQENDEAEHERIHEFTVPKGYELEESKLKLDYKFGVLYFSFPKNQPVEAPSTTKKLKINF